MNKKKPRLDLKELVHDRTKFDKLPTLLQKKIFEFFRVSKIYSGKLKKIETLKLKIRAITPEKRRLSKIITEDFNYISNELSLGIPSIYLTPEYQNNRYRVDIDWKGKRKKFTIGPTLEDVKILCEHYKPGIGKTLTSKNYKDVIKKSLQKIIEKKLKNIGRDKFEMLHKIQINKETKDIVLIESKDELEKRKDKPTKKPSTISVKGQHSSVYGSGGKVLVGAKSNIMKNKNPLGKVPTIDDTPIHLKNNYSDKKIKLKPMNRKK